MEAHSHRVLYIDAYDSFSNNIVALLQTKLNVDVTVIKIDTAIDHLEEFLAPFSGIILGPGPGTPHKPEDIGLHTRIWGLDANRLVPILGICLGFQSLVFAFGGAIHRLPRPRHGIVRKVRHRGEAIFDNLPPQVDVVQYHSLHASLDSAEAENGELIPLAWDLKADNTATEEWTDNLNPDAILMAVKHKHRPYYGVQFHPESICSSDQAQRIILNWWQQAYSWRKDLTTHCARPTLPTTAGDVESSVDDYPSGCSERSGIKVKEESPLVHTKVLPLSNITISRISSVLGLVDDEIVVLDSENHQRPDLGCFSIIGLVTPYTPRFEYQAGSDHIRRIQDGKVERIDLVRSHRRDVLSFLKSYVQALSFTSKHEEIPFWGGLVGYISYEAGLETIGAYGGADRQDQNSSDLSFAFIERSIVISHLTEKLYIQSLLSADNWVNDVAYVLTNTPPPSPGPETSLYLDAHISIPDEAGYKSAIRECQSFIGQGESYELCFTGRTTVTTAPQSNPWALYSRLRQLNPAPFAAYIRIGGLTLLSSSPERFLSWTRPQAHSESGGNESVCQFRPIKGTLNRQPDPNQPPLTFAQAERLLATPKEIAENLMIVDLIRHDVHGVAGANNVFVPKLMVVEEYETLFQLVSVIEGTLRVPRGVSQFDTHISPKEPSPVIQNKGKSGIDVLAASLPPGSMTGAPKLRSCQLLKFLEARPRGIYSGVVGYLDVGGGGDFSVVIRSAFRWDDPHSERDTWTIGAGGAITTLSTEEGEYEEMMAKLKSTLRLFEHDKTTYGTVA
ncbi:uncharacterized protein KY384_003623 [Bacidia gigantensis]|uniref:uncharacterized protein n=1 Tax=Bacidia gigantensis TaxID=2732470 RepID=UPI001D0471D6|nr:uncharacterized protein KY384_003623 [Bacidia gigantensis]KAG8531987.1 hypothetical protein KY384_003623 [Bacidia gigantensis]